MKTYIKSVITIVITMVISLCSVTASAERRSITQYDKEYIAYLEAYEDTYSVYDGYYHYRFYPDGDTCNYYDWNMDKVIDIADAQLVLNDYIRYMSLGNRNNIPATLNEKIENHCTLYRRNVAYSRPEESIVCAQLILRYYTKVLSGTDYVRQDVIEPGPAGPMVVGMYKRKANSFLDWLQHDGIKVKG